MNVLKGLAYILMASSLTLAGCTSDKSKAEEFTQTWAQDRAGSKAQEEARTLNSSWLRQAYYDYVVKNTEVKVTTTEVEGDSAKVEFQVHMPTAELRANLLGVISKIPPDAERNFNFADGASLIQKQLGLAESKAWSPQESVILKKGSNGWRLQD